MQTDVKRMRYFLVLPARVSHQETLLSSGVTTVVLRSTLDADSSGMEHYLEEMVFGYHQKPAVAGLVVRHRQVADGTSVFTPGFCVSIRTEAWSRTLCWVKGQGTHSPEAPEAQSATSLTELDPQSQSGP